MIAINVLFDVKGKTIDLLDTLKEVGQVEVDGFVFCKGDEDLLIACDNLVNED